MDPQMVLCHSVNGCCVMRTLKAFLLKSNFLYLEGVGILKETPCETFTRFNLQKCYNHVESRLERLKPARHHSCFVEGATKKCSALVPDLELRCSSEDISCRAKSSYSPHALPPPPPHLATDKILTADMTESGLKR